MLCAQEKDVSAPRDEEGFVTEGPLHPVPPAAPHWINPEHAGGPTASPATSNAGSAMNVDGGSQGRWVEQLAPQDPVLENVQIQVAASELQKGKAVAEENLVQTVTIQGKEVQLPGHVQFPIFRASVLAPKPALRSVIYGPSIPEDPLITIMSSLLK